MSADRAQYAVRESHAPLTPGSERQWADRNAGFFARGAEPVDEAAAIVLAGALMLAVAEVSLSGDEAAARLLADGVIAVIARLDITSRG
jgi:hypothetical protein